jgi:hypothetical protein
MANETPIIPKIIWTYWQGEKNGLVEVCLASWRKRNPDYRMVIMNDGNVQEHLPGFELPPGTKTPQKFSDFVRLEALARHGGVWVDASLFCLQPLDEWLGSKSFCGFYIGDMTTKTEFPVIESWFLASAVTPFIRKWRDRFWQIETPSEKSMENINAWIEKGVDKQNIKLLPYLAIHFACQVVQQKETTEIERADMTLFKAEDTAFKYLDAEGWNSEKALEELVRSFDNGKPFPGKYVLKFRGHERRLATRKMNPDSLIWFKVRSKPPIDRTVDVLRASLASREEATGVRDIASMVVPIVILVLLALLLLAWIRKRKEERKAN